MNVMISRKKTSSLMRLRLEQRRFGAAAAPHGQTAKSTARTIAGNEAIIQARQDWLRGAHP